MTENAYTTIYISTFIIQLFYIFFFYFRILNKNNKEKKRLNINTVSVIISARNEADNLKKNIPYILKQKEINFELIVVNDNSQDKTHEILKNIEKNNNKIKIINADKNTENSGNKKKALTKAILNAKNEILIFTDADCRPASDLWLKKTAEKYSEKTEIVLGYGAYEKTKGFLNKIIRYETDFNAMQYMSFAAAGFPYSATGRNLSYKKSLFLKHNGFNSHIKTLSGDDDLFINEAATRNNTAITIEFDTKTISPPKKNIKEYLKQKKRHLSAGMKYNTKNKFISGTEIFSRMMFYISFIALLAAKNTALSCFLPYLVRISLIFIILKIFNIKTKEKNNLFFIPIFDVLIPLINLYIVILTVFKKEIKWK